MEVAGNLKHLAIIMDGNGRWATKRSLPRNFGHRQGVKNVDTILKLCIDEDIPFLSLYVFSTENWKRPAEEVDGLFKIVREHFEKIDNYIKAGVKIVFSGARNNLPQDLLLCFDEAMLRTSSNSKITLNLCFNYGGREEILNAANSFLSEKLPNVTESVFTSRLYTGKFPDVDFIIRTGGQKRLSNFLLFTAAYAELYFSDCLWPDFNKNEFKDAISEYYRRVRNFGSI